MNRDMEFQRLKEENEKLKEDLKSAIDKCLDLQPYRDEVLPGTLEREYKSFVPLVYSRVEHIIDPIIDTDKHFQDICQAAEYDPNRFAAFRKELRDSDISAMTYKDVDTDIVAAVVMRFLQREILEEHLLGIPELEAQVLLKAEQGMRALEPKRDEGYIRAWIAETYHALSNSDVGRQWKETKATQSASTLAQILRVFWLPKYAINGRKVNSFDALTTLIKSSFIDPAVEIHDLIAFNKTFFSFQDGIDIGGSEDPQSLLRKKIDELDCRNAEKARKRFTRADWEKGLNNVHYVCTAGPALVSQQFRSGEWQDEELLCKAQVIVSATDGTSNRSKKPPPPGLIQTLYDQDPQ